MVRFAFVAVAGFALAPIAAAQEPDLSGKWSGYWQSDNGHRGPLHARFVPLDADTYRVTYRGRFALVIPFRYSTTMDATPVGDGTSVLTAEKRLGPFGSFRTTANATGTSFDAAFSSRRDSGRFVLNKR